MRNIVALLQPASVMALADELAPKDVSTQPDTAAALRRPKSAWCFTTLIVKHASAVFHAEGISTNRT